VTTPSGCRAWAGVDDIPADVAALHSAAEWCGYLELATDILWSATGRRWRGSGHMAEVVLRAAPPLPGEPGWPWHQSWGHCRCYRGTNILGPSWALDWVGGHHEPNSIRLPHPDVTEVTSVTIDGQLFDAYRLDGAWLSRTDGSGWPMCGERTVATYAYGKDAPAGGRLACVELAVEFGRATCSDPKERGRCQLPRRVQTVTRQGITYDMLDDFDFLQDGLTGIYSVDAWIRSVNPYGIKQAASVWSPDLRRARTTT
jgi:hypothetical protein